jgi:DoxX-like family
MTKKNKIIYWVSTLWLASGMLATGTLQLFKAKAEGALAPPGVYGITHLGYPVYFLTILGAWKILGVVAVLIPKFPLLKEWAYAGFFFAMTGAAFSHIAVGDPTKELVPSLLLLVLTVVSWYFRSADRKIPAPHIAEAPETVVQHGAPVQQRS